MLRVVALLLSASAASAWAAPEAAAASGIDWDLLLKALGLLVTIGATLIQVRNFRSSSRSSLKTDLEILKLIDPGHPHRASVERHTDQLIGKFYPDSPVSPPITFERIGIGVFGFVWALGFAYWTFVLSTPTFSWWSLATGYVAVMGLAWLGMGITGLGMPVRGRSGDAAKAAAQAPEPPAPARHAD